MPNPMMAMMFAMRNSIPLSTMESLRERSPVPLQEGIGVGDTAFQMRDDGFYDDHLTIVEVLDPTDVVPDWEARVANGRLYCRWYSADNPEGDYGWFARIFTLPIARETYEDLRASFVAHGPMKEEEQFDTEAWPELDRVYRDFAAEATVMTDKNVAPARCEVCFSHQVQVTFKHISHTRGSAVWHTLPDGSVKLAPTSRQSECENEAQITCLDCGWNRELEDSELMLGH